MHSQVNDEVIMVTSTVQLNTVGLETHLVDECGVRSMPCTIYFPTDNDFHYSI